ncbi:histone-lysine N-methyltransferase PRDM16-like [Patiria miniata]|uniref:C2H2-type domain-containing protein n=1 Tax=Patiria miniata TaxID=46514 RepID=A0A914B9D2_PATMI|nr:histone-lysine N-methyltransferase PRDM16-like [Patiria miniata]
MAPPTETKTYKCDKCGHTFQKLKGLLRHLRINHGPAAFLYCRHCGFHGKRRDHLRRHYKMEHPAKLSEVSEIDMEPERRGRPTAVAGPEHPPKDVRLVQKSSDSQAPLKVVVPLNDKSSQEAVDDGRPALKGLPPCLSPIPSSPQRTVEEDSRPLEDETPKKYEDDAISLSSMSPLELDIDEDLEKIPEEPQGETHVPEKRQKSHDKAPAPPKPAADARPKAEILQGSSPPRRRGLSFRARKYPKLATFVEHTETIIYVDNVIISR